MAIRWASTPESIANNEPSVLAVVETLLAMGGSVWIAVHWQTYVHIAVTACIAPLLLMRTSESFIRAATSAGMLTGLMDRAMNWATRQDRSRYWLVFALVPLALFWLPASYLLARISAWLDTLRRDPLSAITVIPDNWRYATILVDSTIAPEILPLPRRGPIESHPNRPIDREISKMVEFIRNVFAKTVNQPRLRVYFLAVFLLSLLPAVAYRWSLKSTAIIWFPLLWALRSVREVGTSLQAYFSRYVRDPLTWIVLCASLLCLVGLTAKIVFWNEWPGFVEWWNSTPLRRVLSLYVAPTELPRWQLAMAINSLIAIVMFFLAWHWLVRLDPANPEAESWPRRIFRAGLFIRPILSIYTIVCTLYITIRAASQWNLPPLGDKWFPWP